jgi:ribosomal protein L11 methyltransferase
VLSAIQYQVGLKMPLAVSFQARGIALLSALGCSVTDLVEEELRQQRIVSVYLLDRRAALVLRAAVKSACFPGAALFWKVHRASDWSTQWKKGWKPFALTRRLQLIPLWQDSRFCPKTRAPVFLETTNAFGTGLHETTRFTAQLIEGLSGQFDSFLDVGTGSGILAIVALKCGARRVTGVDIDPSAVKVARQNLKVNGLMCVLRARDLNDFNASRPFDCVAANLVSMDLIEFRDRIISFVRPGGHLIVSGISLPNIARVKKAFAQKGLRLIRVLKGREWSAIQFCRS